MPETRSGTITRWGRVPAWWLLHAGVDADRFCVLAAMATYADNDGVCAPSQATLARLLKRSRPWVNRVVAQLAEEGFLEKTTRARRDGATTSCLYRLRLAPPEDGVTRPDATRVGVASETGPVPAEDSPRHSTDRNQPEAEQIQDSRAAASAASARTTDGHRRTEASTEVPKGWRPSDDDVREALRLCPDADLEVHTARFVARCRAKGYRYAHGAVGDAWLSWLLEDRNREARCAAEPRPRAERRSRPASPSERADERFAAWAAASSAPRTDAWR